MALLLQNATIVTSDGKREEDLTVGSGEVTETIDCSGKFVIPGAIDVHVHFREPGGEHKEDFASGTRAAAAGGIVMVLDMPNTNPSTTSREALLAKRALVQDKAVVNFDLYMGATYDEKTGESNVDEFLASDAVAYKIYVGSSTGNLLVDDHDVLEGIFEKVGQTDRLIVVHAEDEALINEHIKNYEGEEDPDPSVHSKIRDDEVAYNALKFLLHLAKKYGTRVHVAHLSSARELEEFRKFKSDRITCEVSPHHLFLDQGAYAEQGNLVKMNPSLRTKEDRVELMEGLLDGTVNLVATDHAPHTLEEKSQGFWKAPGGVPGVETMLPLLLDSVNHGELKLSDVVRLLHEEPVRIFGLKLKDCWTVVDMDLEQIVENGGPGAKYTKCGWSPFEGRALKGWPILTVVNGEIIR